MRPRLTSSWHDLGRLHEGGDIELGLEGRRLGQGLLGIPDRELNRAQTFKHWCIWGGEWWERKWEL